MGQQKSKSYWQANLRLIRNLLMIWAFVSFGAAIILARFLNQFYLGQLPLGFWIAQQGSLLSFVGLIFVYSIKMDALDRQSYYLNHSDVETQDQRRR